MATQSTPNKKERIINAARKLFLERGARNTSMRDIAKDAEVNLAMVNYYFSSKDALFDIIFDEVFQRMADTIVPQVPQGESAEETISDFVDNYIEWYITNVDQLNFIFQVLYSEPERLWEKMQSSKMVTVVFNNLMLALEKDVSEGYIKRVEHPEHLIMNILSLCAFPFVAKPLLQRLMDKDDEAFVQMMRARKQEVVGIFHAYLVQQ